MLFSLPLLCFFLGCLSPPIQGHLPSLAKHSSQLPELWFQCHLQPAHHNHRQAPYELTLGGWNAQGPRG